MAIMEKHEKQPFTHAVKVVDYKDTELLRRFLNPNGRILARRITGTSARNQRKIANAIKRARFMGLLPYIER